MKIQNPHDKFFKETMGNLETAKDFLANYLPESVMRVVNLDTLEPQKDSFISPELEESFSDLLFEVDISGKESYLYFLFEHKSYPDKGIALQLLKYMIEIWEAKMNKEFVKGLPIIIPLVMYHGTSHWRTVSSLGEMLLGYDELPEDLKIYVPNFNHVLYDVSVYADEDIKGNAKTRILLTLLRDIFTKDGDKLQESIIRSIRYLNELEDRQTGTEYLETIIRYVLSAGNSLTKRNVKQMITQIEMNYPEGSEMTMTMAEMWMEEGMEKGMEKGLEKGMKKGLEKGLEKGGAAALSETAIQLLTEKFGKVPQDMKDGISKTDTAILKLLLVNSFRFQELDEARKYIQ
ncbi:Rpn family recombination-promoting nuclease/putative transposase [Sporosarcina limicola]|uniref:Transposase/invertase (TIGR01784 family) n=1 Tax=Sporosarcina limicola TaxID=34101 RepID=A0A927MM30_9BACL|nr:putative transposase/invertase (TIGR01784 family) [Sporosarcina limicola]